MYQDIFSLEAGHYLEFEKNNIKTIKYFQPLKYFNYNRFKQNKKKNIKFIQEKIEKVLKDNIYYHSITDTK